MEAVKLEPVAAWSEPVVAWSAAGAGVSAGAGTSAGAGAGTSAGAGSVGRLVESSQADDRRLIALVRARRLLYARTNMPVAKYYAHCKRLWEDVAGEMGRSVPEVRRKWSHIRNSYSRHLRNELGGARTGRGRAVSRWYLADDLAFLRDHMATDTRSSFSHYAPASLELPAVGGAALEAVDVKPPPWARERSPPRAALGPAGLLVQPKLEPVCSYNEDSAGSWAAEDGAGAGPGPDAYFQFFRGVQPDYQALTAHRQRAFLRHCLAGLHALLDEQDADLLPPPPATPPAPGVDAELCILPHPSPPAPRQ